MRQLKTMLRARKAQMLGCGPCECLTLKCWRENDEYCNCGETKRNIPVTSIGEPSSTSIELLEGRIDTSVTFTYSPANATNPYRDITITSDDETIAKSMIDSANDGVAVLYVMGEGVGTTQVAISTGDITYHVDVTVNLAP